MQRVALSDFDRFKLRKAKQRRNKIRTVAFYNIRKTASRNGTLYGKKKMAKGGNKPRPKKVAAKDTSKSKDAPKTTPKKK